MGPVTGWQKWRRCCAALVAALPVEYAALMFYDPGLLATAIVDWATALEGLTPWW